MLQWKFKVVDITKSGSDPQKNENMTWESGDLMPNLYTVVPLQAIIDWSVNISFYLLLISLQDACFTHNSQRFLRISLQVPTV